MWNSWQCFCFSLENTIFQHRRSQQAQASEALQLLSLVLCSSLWISSVQKENANYDLGIKTSVSAQGELNLGLDSFLGTSMAQNQGSVHGKSPSCPSSIAKLAYLRLWTMFLMISWKLQTPICHTIMISLRLGAKRLDLEYKSLALLKGRHWKAEKNHPLAVFFRFQVCSFHVCTKKPLKACPRQKPLHQTQLRFLKMG